MDACCIHSSLAISKVTGPKFIKCTQIIIALNVFINVAIFQFLVERQCKEWRFYLSIFAICPRI